MIYYKGDNFYHVDTVMPERNLIYFYYEKYQRKMTLNADEFCTETNNMST